MNPDRQQHEADIGDEIADREARTESLRRKCFMLAKEIGLTDTDRHELSIMLPGAPDTGAPWRALSYDQLARLADWLTGWTFIHTILRDRPSTETGT